MLDSYELDEIRQIIRSQTLRPNDCTKEKYRNVIKQRNKYYFRYMENGKKYVSKSYLSPGLAYIGYIEARLKKARFL